MKINALAGVLRRVFTHHEVMIDPLAREHRLGLAVVDVYVAHKAPQAPHRSPICATGRGVTRAGPACGCIKGTGNARGGRGGRNPGGLAVDGRGGAICDQTPWVTRRRLGGGPATRTYAKLGGALAGRGAPRGGWALACALKTSFFIALSGSGPPAARARRAGRCTEPNHQKPWQKMSKDRQNCT